MSASATKRDDPFISRDKKRLPIFDGIRGYCAVMLLIVHVAWTASLIGNYNQKPSNLAGATVVNGFQIVVGIFFLLSGAFLFRPFARWVISDGKRPELVPYFVRRGLRLLPPYYLMTVVSLLILNYNSINSVWYVMRPLVLMQNYNFMWYAGMDISWTVPTEVQWYIVLPLIAFGMIWFARRGKTPIARAHRLMIPIPLMFAGGIAWWWYIHTPSMGIFPPQYSWPISMIGNVACGLMVGIWSAQAETSPHNTPKVFRLAARHPLWFWLGALAVFAFECSKPWGRPGYSDYDSLAGGIVFYLSVLAFATFIVIPMFAPGARSRVIDGVLGNRVAVFLGRISYGVYLWHFVVMNLEERSGSIFGNHGGQPLTVPAMRGRTGFWQLEAMVLAGSIVVAVVSYYGFERPILHWGERRLKARQNRRDQAALEVQKDTLEPVNP